MLNLKIYTKQEKLAYVDYLIRKFGDKAEMVLDEIIELNKTNAGSDNFDLKETKKLFQNGNTNY